MLEAGIGVLGEILDVVGKELRCVEVLSCAGPWTQRRLIGTAQRVTRGRTTPLGLLRVRAAGLAEQQDVAVHPVVLVLRVVRGVGFDGYQVARPHLDVQPVGQRNNDRAITELGDPGEDRLCVVHVDQVVVRVETAVEAQTVVEAREAVGPRVPGDVPTTPVATIHDRLWQDRLRRATPLVAVRIVEVHGGHNAPGTRSSVPCGIELDHLGALGRRAVLIVVRHRDGGGLVGAHDSDPGTLIAWVEVEAEGPGHRARGAAERARVPDLRNVEGVDRAVQRWRSTGSGDTDALQRLGVEVDEPQLAGPRVDGDVADAVLADAGEGVGILAVVPAVALGRCRVVVDATSGVGVVGCRVFQAQVPRRTGEVERVEQTTGWARHVQPTDSLRAESRVTADEGGRPDGRTAPVVGQPVRRAGVLVAQEQAGVAVPALVGGGVRLVGVPRHRDHASVVTGSVATVDALQVTVRAHAGDGHVGTAAVVDAPLTGDLHTEVHVDGGEGDELDVTTAVGSDK